MLTVIQCPHCSQKYRVPQEQIGGQVQCQQQQCRQSFIAFEIGAPPPQPAIPPEFDDSIPVEKPRSQATSKPDQTTISRDTELRLEAKRLAKDQPGITRLQGWIAIALLAGILCVPLLTPRLAPERWEYKIISPDDLEFERVMADMGKERWELLEARRAMDSNKRMGYEMIFKRALR